MPVLVRQRKSRRGHDIEPQAFLRIVEDFGAARVDRPDRHVLTAQAVALQQPVDEVFDAGRQDGGHVGAQAHAETVIGQVEGHAVEALVVGVGGEIDRPRGGRAGCSILGSPATRTAARAVGEERRARPRSR